MPRIELFISRQCLSYNPAMELFNVLKEAFPGTEFEVVDCRAEREKTREAGVVVDPAFVFEGRIMAVGLPEKNLLIEKIGTMLKK